MKSVIALLGLTAVADAHVAAWAKSIYCIGGTSGNDDQNTKTAVDPLYTRALRLVLSNLKVSLERYMLLTLPS